VVRVTRGWIIVAATMALVSASGCRMDIARERSLARARATDQVLRRLGEREARRPRDFQADLDEIPEIEKFHDRARAENYAWYNDMRADEFERWRTNQPVYGRVSRELLEGDFDRAQSTAAQMID
jgi:hypothetical protein